MSDKQGTSTTVAAAAAAPEDNIELLTLEDEEVLKKSLAPLPTKVVVHPLVLLSVVDHYHRVAENTNRRVCGVLLGSSAGSTVDISNCYAGTLPLLPCPIDLAITRIHTLLLLTAYSLNAM